MLKAMSAPYGQLTFMPTGGINADNLLDYLKFNKIVACGGSFMVADNLIKEKKWDEITALTRDAVKKMLGLEFLHMGINSDSKEEGEKGAKLFALMFGMPLRETSKSTFASEAFEFMHSKGPGVHGHIAIRTNFVDRAMAYFKRMGFEFDESTITYDEKSASLSLFTSRMKFAALLSTLYRNNQTCNFKNLEAISSEIASFVM